MTFTHLDEHGKARMVDITAKAETRRVATAVASVKTTVEGCDAFLADLDGVAAARVAGQNAAGATSRLIPLCHPLLLDYISIDVSNDASAVVVAATIGLVGKTGVEMEALTAVGASALCTGAWLSNHDFDYSISIDLLEKQGGRRGLWQHASLR